MASRSDKSALHKLGLGTAQFGLDYGVSNNGGKTPQMEVCRILEAASLSDIRIIDTASMYGDSEEVLGISWPACHNFQVVTKTPRLLDAESAELLAHTLFRSLERLKLDSIYGLMIHNADDLFSPYGHEIIHTLINLREQGVIRKTGVSVYNASQIDSILEMFTPDLVQLPLNVLDQRLLASGHLALLKKHGIEVHARSAFLQGLLLMDLDSLNPYFNPIRKILQELRRIIATRGITPLSAALGFVTSIDEVDAVICGVENLRHFAEINEASEVDCNLDLAGFAVNDEAMINPALWKLI